MNFGSFLLLGKKFYMHDIIYDINADDIVISNEGFVGEVVDIYDYGMNKYYSVKLENNDLVLINARESELSVGDTLHFTFNEKDLGVYDKDFGVKLI